ncbi:MAG TPA: hypothetical protein PLG43_12470, partial [Spirochaetia bacterium]|nr:hypothetical protein [Spirochaetia bacterium]
DGVETLRVARSRHSSSDFERSARQQQILASLKNQLARLGLKDMGKAYDLVKTLSNYVQTNFTFFELVDLFTRYLNTPITKQEVLSTKNVLYTTYSNVYLLKEEDAQLDSNSTGDVASDESTPSQGEEGSILNTGTEFDENFDKGEWILLPQNDDWNLIRWYIRTLIGGEKDE